MFFLFSIHAQRNNLLICIFVVVLLGYIIQQIFNSLYPSVISLTDIHKCPACYGTTICNNVFNNSFEIKPLDIYSTLSHLFFSKNVFYGTMGEAKIVVKKLAHDVELKLFDKMLCDDIEFRQLCWGNIKNADDSHNTIDYESHIKSAVSLNSQNVNKLILCPTTNHLRSLINELFITNSIDLANLWTIIKINPEPIILMILSANGSWPVPKYYGSCGRIIIESYIGLPLSLYYNEPWLRRAKIAIDLLEAARIFTFGSAKYAYYLTDITSDNIAIGDDDKPKFIDLENIFILNKNISTIDRPKNWYNLHTSDNGIECEDCFAFSPMDICSHHISDHNYYAICQHILHLERSKSSISKGFLHTIPIDISEKYPELIIMLNECAMPSIEQSRIIAAEKLQKILTVIIKEVDQQ